MRVVVWVCVLLALTVPAWAAGGLVESAGVWAGLAVAWLGTCGSMLWGWGWRHRGQIAEAVGEATAFAEKFYGGSAPSVMEDEAVRYAGEHWPAVPEWVVREGIRALCERRKARAEGLGAKAPALPRRGEDGKFVGRGG